MSEKVAKEEVGSSQACGEGKVDKKQNVPSAAEAESESLEGLLSTLKQQIKDSNWLEVNTPQRWEQENPELAAEYKKVLDESSSTPSTTG